MKEKTFYKTPSVRVVRLEVEKAVLDNSNNYGDSGAAGGRGTVHDLTNDSNVF